MKLDAHHKQDKVEHNAEHDRIQRARREKPDCIVVKFPRDTFNSVDRPLREECRRDLLCLRFQAAAIRQRIDRNDDAEQEIGYLRDDAAERVHHLRQQRRKLGQRIDDRALQPVKYLEEDLPDHAFFAEILPDRVQCGEVIPGVEHRVIQH